MPNHLANENSPYLLQHADNPVDWYPWDQAALDRARQENKPVFLSIGYAACHWCHVMAHESFEDARIAAFMNEHFVNIKVDREERPDLDSIYMSAVVAMTGQGGWPMSVFLTPQGEPFFGGTYYPPVRRYNMPSFSEVLAGVQRAWAEDQAQVVVSAQKVSQYIQQVNQTPTADSELHPDSLESAAQALVQAYDWKYGGWGSAPKFPQPMAIEFLLRQAVKGDSVARDVAAHNLSAMARGGMYDAIGGGFARYSTDNEWLVPHFEKMLYDNAQLALAYLHGYLVLGDEELRRTCQATLDFIVREMTHPAGGFYSSLDADSEGVEGKYYLWTPTQIQYALPDPADYEFFTSVYPVSERGNFEGSNILQRQLTNQQLAEKFAIPIDDAINRLDSLHQRLLDARQPRIRPGTDDKILVAWNALTLIAFAEAARYLQNPDYLAAAQANATFLLDQLYSADRLLRSWRAGTPRHSAYLEDHASLILGLLALYQSDPDPAWFAAAENLTHQMVEHFRDPQVGFYDTRDDNDPLITRPKDLQDNATPSGNALAASALLRMAAYTGNNQLARIVESMLSAIQPQAVRYPTAFAQWLCALDDQFSTIREVAILGDPQDPLTLALWHTIWAHYRPSLVAAASNLPVPGDAPPLLRQRGLINSRPTAYVCQNFACLRPVNLPAELAQQLAASPSSPS